MNFEVKFDKHLQFILFIFIVILFIPVSTAAQLHLNQTPDSLNSYGIQLANAGNLTEAIRVWRHALNMAADNVHLYNNIGSALKRMGHDEHAYKWYSAALKIKPAYWTWYNLALIYRDRGQTKDAIFALKKSLQLKPDFRQSQNLLRRLQQGLLTVKKLNRQDKVKLPVTAFESATKQSIDFKPDKTEQTKHYSKPVIRHPEKIVRLPDDKGGQVFLTFDGGGDDKGFDSIISSLAERNVKCTFFLTGKFARKYPKKVLKLLAQGHEIANHSMNHPDMKKFSAEKIAKEIEDAEQSFVEVTGKRGAPFFRFPFGHQNKRVEKIVETLGYRPVYWHIDTIDWREDPVKTIISRVDKKLKRGAVILMHLGSRNGAEALDRILDIISERGYSLARLSDLDPAMLATLP
jgi:peptidoglycan/xylan/chitin deacetylase (PgdA/CDA1 family)